MNFKYIVRRISLINSLTQQTRDYTRDLFRSKVSHYLYRAKLIDSIRLSLRTNPPTSLTHLLNDRFLDSFVVTHALRSAPSPDSALSLVETLVKSSNFTHTQHSFCALATIFAKFRRIGELKSLIDSINAGKLKNIRVSYMNLMQWYAAAEDLDSVLQTLEEYKSSNGPSGCTESYNIVMGLYAQFGKDSEAVHIFHKMIDEGAVPNCRTYTIMIEHLVSSGKLNSALEVFEALPFMRIKRTLKQYSLLVEGFIGAKQFEVVKTLLDEMSVDGILPGRALRLSLEQMHAAGFVKETEEYLKEMIPDERIKTIGRGIDCRDEDEDEDNDIIDSSGGDDVYCGRLKPWLDPRALASALQNWSPEEVSMLEEAKIVWTTRLACKILRNFRSPETAWKFFCWVDHQPGFSHDIYTIQRMVALLARSGHVELVDKLISRIQLEGMRFPFSTIRMIIEFYGISKKADAALKVFRDSRNLCGVISKFNLMLLYSSLLRTLTKCGRNSHALDVLEEMILNGISPDIQTFSGLMHHFAKNEDLKMVQKLCLMVRQSGIEPDAYMFKVLIEAYCKRQRAVLAWRVFQDLRNLNLIPDAATKDLLVKSLWKEGKRREAAAVEESCEEIKEILPLALQGQIWMVSSAYLTKVFNVYSTSFAMSTGG